MPLSSRRIQHLAEGSASQHLTAQAACLEVRYQALTQQFLLAQVQYQAVHTQYRYLQKECRWLQHVIVVKQRLVEQLLPYYPLPLTPDMLTAIELY